MCLSGSHRRRRRRRRGAATRPDGGPVRARLKVGVLVISVAVVIYAGSMSALSAREPPGRQKAVDATSSSAASWTHVALGVDTANRASGFGGALSFSKAPRVPVVMAGKLARTGSGYGIRPFGQRGGIMSQLTFQVPRRPRRGRRRGGGGSGHTEHPRGGVRRHLVPRRGLRS